MIANTDTDCGNGVESERQCSICIRHMKKRKGSRRCRIRCPLRCSDFQIVYKRYASLYFCCAIEQTDNELLTLEIIHRYVELLDKYFGSVSVPSRRSTMSCRTAVGGVVSRSDSKHSNRSKFPHMRCESSKIFSSLWTGL